VWLSPMAPVCGEPGGEEGMEQWSVVRGCVFVKGVWWDSDCAAQSAVALNLWGEWLEGRFRDPADGRKAKGRFVGRGVEWAG
jgi:hypothetical protein